MSGEKSARRVLIVTVGQTAAPIEAALAHHAPDGVVFIASQGSHTVAAELVSAFKGEFLHYTLLLNDPESLKESYQQALAALRQALAWDAQTITADLTGGTKPMVAGLALALSGRGVTFSYVGGEQRDEYGRVRSGTEQMRLLEDPTTRFHVREWEALQRAWNAWRFQDAQEQLSRILARPLSPSEQRFFEHLRGVVQGLEAWDTFHHAEAQRLMAEHLPSALLIAEAWRHGSKVRVLSELSEQLTRLYELLASGQRPSRLLLADLLANAARRAEAGRYDDALARLYRAVELAAEADLYARHGVNLRDPATCGALSPELKSRVRDTLGLKEALNLAYDIDLYFGKSGTLAQRLYSDYQTVLKPLLARRHQSILAHGLTPVGREAYEELREYLEAQGAYAAPAWPRW